MHVLLEGVARFRATVMPEMASHFAALLDGQHPHTLFVACSDSRVDPSLITQTRPGEIFVLRNAGNLVPVHGEDDGSASAVEYAVSALGVERIVVCGHSGCGAMGALLDPGAAEGLPTVRRWIRHAQPTRAAVAASSAPDPLGEAIRHNARHQLVNLRSHPCVQRALEAGDLELEAWVYDLGTGAVEVVGHDGASR